MKISKLFTTMPCGLKAALLLVLAACGGGVETGGTGASAYVQGPITGFGSVIVAGVHFDDSCSSCIEDADGTRRSRNDLRLGMMVEIESGPIGDDGSGGRIATATRVRLASELLGPVGVIDLTNARIGVLGQLVRLTPATVIDGVADGAAALVSGDVVEVYGFFDPIGGYVATRIERRATAPASYRVRGLVRDLDRMGHSMRIGMQGFDLADAVEPAGLDNDQFVRLAVSPVQVGGRWKVQSITIEDRSAGDRDEAEIEGLISAFSSKETFSVNGVRINTSSTTTFVDGSDGLAVGVRVRVRGRGQAGVLVAASVDIRSDADAFGEGVDIRDVIGNVDATAQTFALRGITVFYGTQPSPRVDNGTIGEVDRGAGRRVRVRGVLSPDRTRVVATRIEFINN